MMCILNKQKWIFGWEGDKIRNQQKEDSSAVKSLHRQISSFFIITQRQMGFLMIESRRRIDAIRWVHTTKHVRSDKTPKNSKYVIDKTSAILIHSQRNRRNIRKCFLSLIGRELRKCAALLPIEAGFVFRGWFSFSSSGRSRKIGFYSVTHAQVPTHPPQSGG